MWLVWLGNLVVGIFKSKSKALADAKSWERYGKTKITWKD